MELHTINNPGLHQPPSHQQDLAATLKPETDTGRLTTIEQSAASPQRSSRLNAGSVTSPFNPDVGTPRQTEQADLDICSFINQINEEIEIHTSLTHGGVGGEDPPTSPPASPCAREVRIQDSDGIDEFQIKDTQACRDGAKLLRPAGQQPVHSGSSISCVECSLVLSAIDWLDANALHVIGLWCSAVRYHSPAHSPPRQENFARLSRRNVELIQVQIQKMAGWGGLVPDQAALRTRELNVAAVNNGSVLGPAALGVIEKYFMSQL